MHQRQRSLRRGGTSVTSQKKGSLHNQYLNKSCYFQSKSGVFLNPKSEETFVQETMFYFNLDLFQQTQMFVILISIFKIIPWFNLTEMINYQDICLILTLIISYGIGHSLKNKKKHHFQRFVIIIVIFVELMIIQFLLLDKNLLDQQLWQVIGQIGIIAQNTLSLTTPLQSFLIIFIENVILKCMTLCRGNINSFISSDISQQHFTSYCNTINIQDITINDFTGSHNHLITVYPLFTLIVCNIVNRIMRKYWIFINSFQKSDKCNAQLSTKNMTTFFIIDQHMQFVFQNDQGQDLIRKFEDSNETRVTNFSQLFQLKEQQSVISKDKQSNDKIAIFQEKIQEIIQYDRQIELEVWLDEVLGMSANNHTSNQTEESLYLQAETVGLTQTENHNKILCKLRMGPIMWRNSKMIQIVLEKQTKVSDIVQINEYFYDLLFKNSSDNISQLEKDYLKWYNMVSLGVIKNDDLKELSKCIHEYHQQYIYLYIIRKINNEFHQIQAKNINEFNIKANIIQSVEIVLVKKMNLVNQIQVQFEGSFPSNEVLSDDVLFHHMMVSILDLIIQPVEEKPQDKLLDSNSFKNSPGSMAGDGGQQRKVAEPVFKKFDFKVDCKLKQIRRNQIFDLSFQFEFNCLPETEKLLQKVFKKVRSMNANEFVDPRDLLNQGLDYVNLFLIFLQLKRQDGDFELEKKTYHDILINESNRDSNDEANTTDGESKKNNNDKNNASIYILTISLSVQPVSMQTFTGNKYGDSSMKMRMGSNMGTTISQSMSQKNQQRNSIRCPAPLNLSFARDPKIKLDGIQNASFLWKYRDEKELKKTIFDKSRKKPTTINPKIFQQSQQQNSRINKIPTSKDIDQQQQSSSQQNIQQAAQQQNANNSNPPTNQKPAQITNQSSGSNLSVQGNNSQENTLQNSQIFALSTQCSAQQPPNSLQMNQAASIFHRDSVRKTSSINPDLIQKINIGNSSPKIVPQTQNTKNKRRTSIVGSNPKSFAQDDSNPVNKSRSLSRQTSHKHKVYEEVNTSEEEEKKDLFLSDQKSCQSTQYKIPTSQRKISDVSIQLSGQKSNNQSISNQPSQQNVVPNFTQSIQSQCPSDQKIGLNSRLQSGEKLINPIKAFFENDDKIKAVQTQSERVLRFLVEPQSQQEIFIGLQKQITDALKLYKHLFIQDTSLVVKQIINHSKAFDGQENKDPKNSPFLVQSQSVNAGDDSDSQSTQQRRKIQRAVGKIKKNTTILERLSGVNTPGNNLRKSFKMKGIIQQQFNDSPNIDSFLQATESGAPSRVSREFDTGQAGITSQTQINNGSNGSNNYKINMQEVNQHLSNNGIEITTECIQSADEDSRSYGQYFEINDRKRASTYDIPLFQNIHFVDEIQSALLCKQVNESRAKTHRRQWLTDDVWRKQHFKRSDTVLVITNNTQIVSQLKQISSITKSFSDCKHVRNTFSLIKEFQQMMVNCNLFLFILIDFLEQPDKCESILYTNMSMIRDSEERMGIPKTFIIGLIDFEKQGEFLKRNYDKLDYWIDQGLNQHTLIEYINQIKKKEIICE